MNQLIEKTDAEKRLFESALQVFAAKGLYGANTQEIAEGAKIAKASLHYYYRRKERLYYEAFGYAINQIAIDLMKSIHPGKSFAITLQRFCDTSIDFYWEKPHILKLFVQESLNGGEVAASHLRRLAERKINPIGLFIKNTQRAVDKGEIQSVDPYQLFITTWSACLFITVASPIVTEIVPIMKKEPQEFIRARKKHIFQVIYHGVVT